MKPLTSLLPFAKWILRITLVIFIIYYFKDSVINEVNFKNISFYISLFFLISSSLLIIGGFTSKDTLTVLSSSIILIISIYHFIRMMPHPINSKFFMFLIPISISFYFVTSGNKNS